MDYSLDPTQIHQLSPEKKRELLAELLREKVRREATFPLSHGQRGLWFLSTLDTAGAACNIHFASRIRSRLNVEALREALQTAIDRHPSLRTTFEERAGEVVQYVHPRMTLSLEIIAAETWSERDLQARLREEVHRSFSLETGPLFRTLLFRRGPDEHIFLACSHHLILDFWSVMVLWHEVDRLYPACVAGNASRPPAASPGSYANFVRWQKALLEGPRREKLEAYWCRTLQGAAHVLDVVPDYSRPPAFSHAADNVHCRIDALTTRRLNALAAEENVTLYVVLLTALQILLGRQTGEEDFLIGSPFSGRSHPDFAETVGCFINLLPIRADLTGNPTFRQLLRRVSDSVWDGLEHQDYPFSLIVEQLGVARDLSRHPLVQVAFTLEQSQQQQDSGQGSFLFAQEGEGLLTASFVSEAIYIEQRTCQMDLEWVLERAGDGLTGILRFCSSLYERATAERLVERFQIVLSDAVTHPDRPISELQWFSSSERRLVVETWNQTDVQFEQDVCLHEFFERQANRNPAAIALSFPGSVHTYGELERQANRLAHHLISLGVGPEKRVGLCLTPSAPMIVAILATLKAGGAYVPLDPRAPTERLEQILDDAEVQVLLIQAELQRVLPSGRFPVVEVTEVLDQTARPADVPGPPASGVRPDNAAYVIYTSGSTGRPKGVLVGHRAICNTIQWRQRDLPLESADRSLWLVPYYFDPSVAILFQAFAAGARLVAPESGELLHPPQLLERLVREEVTIVSAPPRLLELLLREPRAAECVQVRQVQCGGEPAPKDLPARVHRVWKVPLINLYGPTEAAVEATWWSGSSEPPGTSLPIGRPIANREVYVLDARERPVPVGVPGEIYLGGIGLARQYVNDPKLTAERFPAHPFRDEPGRRVYRTGDRGRWLSEGSLEFLGRTDEQVKLRGYRIELGEVECTLTDHPAVMEAAAAIRSIGHGEPLLAAFVVFREGMILPNEHGLRDFVRRRLPSYMVPELLHVVPELPRTRSGKLDRRKLAAIPLDSTLGQRTRTPPRTPLESFLASLWCELLKIDDMGREENFHELGGTSLQGAMFVSRLQRELDQRLPLVTVFELPTIAELARFLAKAFPDVVTQRFGTESVAIWEDHDAAGLNRARAAEGFPDARTSVANSMAWEPPAVHPGIQSPGSDLLVPLRASGNRPPLFLIHPPGGIVVCYQPLAQCLAEQQPVYGIRARGLHPGEELPRRLEEMAAEYRAVIEACESAGPYRIGGWSLGGVIALEVALQLLEAGKRVDLLAFLDTTIPHGRANRAYQSESANSGLEYGFDITLEELAAMPDEQQLPYLWRHVERLGLIDNSAPEDVVQQILDDLKRVFRIHVQLCSEYAVRPFPGKITLFRPEDSPVEVETRHDRGWGELAEEVEVHFVPGQHHTMVKRPHVERLASLLDDCLQQLRTAGSSGSAS